VAVNSGRYNGLATADMKRAITGDLARAGIGRAAVNYKLRDWIFSRQRYWGEPIPVVHCPKCGVVPLEESDLPLELPEVKSYVPTGTGESPLAAIESWVSTTCPACGGKAKRETNTMPQWAGSCWYYLRYLDPKNGAVFAAKDKIDYWMPVRLYVGGAEHAVLHLLYSRFWHKVLFDLGYVNTKEPFVRLINQGMILGENGVKMSKSLGNVLNPEDFVRDYGADSLRLYEMFMGPLEVVKPWNTNGLIGVHRFLERVWRLSEKPLGSGDPPATLIKVLHKTIKKVTNDTATLNLNTAIAQMMIFVNELTAEEKLWRPLWEPFILLLSAYAPHLAEELWEKLGNEPTVSGRKWPAWDEALCVDEEVTVVIQVDGKLREKFSAAKDTPEEALKETALAKPTMGKFLDGKEIARIIVVPNKLVNIVTKR
jgi:leucyl-tRNA synthetase